MTIKKAPQTGEPVKQLLKKVAIMMGDRIWCYDEIADQLIADDYKTLEDLKGLTYGDLEEFGLY